jgi:hypothetical protein
MPQGSAGSKFSGWPLIPKELAYLHHAR